VFREPALSVMCIAFLKYRVFCMDTLNTLPPDIYVMYCGETPSIQGINSFIKKIRNIYLQSQLSRNVDWGKIYGPNVH